MGRHTGPVCKLCRREGAKLFLKGEKCYGAKCPFGKRAYAPGQHGQVKTQKRLSEFGIRLREKQKARRIYSIGERQFRRYFELADASKGDTGEKLLELLERRLDNVLWRMGAAQSRSQARQFVRNGHVIVNGKKVNIPSFSVKVNDVITFKEKAANFVKKVVESVREKSAPEWISFDKNKIEGKVVSMPRRAEIDALIEEHLIVEFYSR